MIILDLEDYYLIFTFIISITLISVIVYDAIATEKYDKKIEESIYNLKIENNNLKEQINKINETILNKEKIDYYQTYFINKSLNILCNHEGVDCK